MQYKEALQGWGYARLREAYWAQARIDQEELFTEVLAYAGGSLESSS